MSFLLISLFYLHSTQWANTKFFILVLGFCEILSWQWHGHLWLEIQERITSLAVWLWRILVIFINQRNTSLKKFCREFVRNWTSYYPVPKEAKWRIQTFCTCITSACLVTKGACLQGKAYDEHRVLWSGSSKLTTDKSYSNIRKQMIKEIQNQFLQWPSQSLNLNPNESLLFNWILHAHIDSWFVHEGCFIFSCQLIYKDTATKINCFFFAPGCLVAFWTSAA